MVVRDFEAPFDSQLRRVHIGNGLFGGHGEKALLRRQGEQAGVVVGQGALVPDLQSGRKFVSEGGKEAAQAFGEGHEGRMTSSASVAGRLTANGTSSPSRASTTCSAMATPALSCASRVLAPR